MCIDHFLFEFTENTEFLGVLFCTLLSLQHDMTLDVQDNVLPSKAHFILPQSVAQVQQRGLFG